MTNAISLTPRDDDILLTLSRRVRCLGIHQIASHWWHDNVDAKRNSRARLKQLEAAGYLSQGRVLASPLPILKAPLIDWRPGESTPDFGRVSYYLKQRFTDPAVPTAIVFALPSAANRCGGQPGRAPRRSEATHDLGLSQVYLNLHRDNSLLAACWVSEATLTSRSRKDARKVPDALLRFKDGSETLVEFGGEYGKAKLLAFHEDCDDQGKAYQLW